MREIFISNYLQDRIEQEQKELKKYKKLTVILIFVAILSKFLSQFATIVIFVFYISLFFLVFTGFLAIKHYSTIDILQKGLEGEIALQQTLRLLPDDFVALYNLPINNAGDIDCVLIGPKGVFAIEVKNHKGTIIYSEEGWTQIKVGRRGGEYQGSLKDPRKQLLTNVNKLKSFLAEQNINKVWIQPILIFTNREAEIVIKKDPSPIIICRVEDVLNIINSSNKYVSPKLVDRICKLLIKNKQI